MSRDRPWQKYPDYVAARARYLQRVERSPLSAAAPPSRLEAAADTGVTLLDLGPAQCRYALTDELPYRFCGKPTANAKEPYCPKHKALCHVGRLDPREVARWIKAAEATLAPAVDDVDRTPGVDEVFARHEEA
jgi:GcrA cell cycle regulator